MWPLFQRERGQVNEPEADLKKEEGEKNELGRENRREWRGVQRERRGTWVRWLRLMKRREVKRMLQKRPLRPQLEETVEIQKPVQPL